MTVFSAIGLCLCGTVAAILMREMKREYVPLLTVGIALTVLLACIPMIGESVGFMRGISSYIDGGCAETVLKALGVAYLTSTAADISRSCGEQSIGGYIETAGKIGIIALSVPLFSELVELALLK